MKTLIDDIKKMLNGFTYQDSGEFLSTYEKMKALGIVDETREKTSPPPPPPRNVTKKPTTHRIAFISDGRGMGAPLAYAIDACTRQGAKIDLLVHGMTEAENISAMENQIKEAALKYHHIQLGMDPIDDILNYIRNHPSLIYMVAMPDDKVVKTLVEETIPKRGRRIPAPLVLIEDHPSTTQIEKSAA